MVKKITCICGFTFERQVETVIDVDCTPVILEKIQTGAFLSYRCPSCGIKIGIELETELIWKSKKTVLLFVPETKRLECLALCAGKNRVDLETNKKVTIKKYQIPVIGYAELADRIAVLSAGFNPLIIEAVKFFILSGKNDADPQKITILFEAITADEKLEFHLHGLRDREVAVLRVPCSLYQRIEADYRKGMHRDIFRALQLGQYLSYKNIVFEEADDG